MEEIGEMIGKGFGIWRQNLNLCIPFLLNFFVSMLVLISFLIIIFLVAMPSIDVNPTLFQNSQDVQDVQAVQDLITQVVGVLGSQGWQMILLIVFLFLGMIVILSLVEAFFMAGAIGMSRQALEKGRADTGAMWSAGRRHYLNMFLYTILAGLISMIGIVFLLPSLGQIAGVMQGEPAPLGIFVAGLLIFILYAFVLSLALAAAPYALVLDGLGPMQAVRAGIDFFRYNKFDVLILWLVVAALSITLQIIGSSISAGNNTVYPLMSLVTSLVNLLVLVPLSTLWWTRLYMNRKGILKNDEVKDPW